MLWRHVARGLRALTHRADVESELDDEVRDYFERARADLVSQGLTPDEAARAARRELGDLGQARETLRAYGWENQVDALLGDLRQAFRTLRQRWGFASVVVLTLAVGIGVNVALFSLFQQALLRPLPVAEPDRLVNLSSPGPRPNAFTFSSQSGSAETVFSYPMFRDLEREQEAFAGLAAHRIFDASLSTGEQARRDTAFFVSGNYFPVLGLKPALGRLLGPQDDRVEGHAESVVLSYAYWQRELGADPAVLGRRLTVNGTPLLIVGVAPQGFHGTTAGARASVFVPITFGGVDTPLSIPEHDDRKFYWVYLFARLADGDRREDAAAAINPLYRAILNDVDAPLLTGADEEQLEGFRAKSLVLEPGAHGQSTLIEPMRERLETLFAVSAVVLLLCCANVGGLMLVRGSARTSEIAVRAAIGATRGRLASLLLCEPLLLALPAALLSLPVALLALRGFASGVPGIPPAAFDVDLSLAAALVALSVAVVSALAFGVFPARHLLRADPATTLPSHGARQTSGKSVTRFRTVLATAQVALSMALLAVTGVLTQSLLNISRIDLGFDVEPVVTFSIAPETSGYSPEASSRLFDRLEEELADLPGAVAVGSAMVPMLAGGALESGATTAGAEARVDTYLNY